ncbi:MAG: hypothetical protein ABR985_21980 [Methanotrichaceae archaeon]|jgi:hypothetical protein
MRLTRKIQRREDRWATLALPSKILQAWDGYKSVVLSWSPDCPDILIVRPIDNAGGPEATIK